MPWLLSLEVSTAPSTGSLKLGQPVPLSNFFFDTNSGWPHPAQANVPSRFSQLSAQLPGASVPCPRSTWYCSGVSRRRHSSSVWVTAKRLSSMAPPPLAFAASSDSGGVAIEQLDRHSLGRAQEGDAHPRPHRGGVAGELDALGLELGDHGIDPADREPEVIEALVGRDRRWVDAVAGRDRRDENVGAAELEVDARLALLHGADHLGAEHAFIPLGGRFGIGGSQMDVVPGVLDHVRSPSVAAWSSVARIARRRNPRKAAHRRSIPNVASASSGLSGSPDARLPPRTAELGEDFLVVLAERGRGRVDARTTMGEGERGQRHAELAFDPIAAGVAVNDAARRQLRIGERLAHGAHARGWHVARLQELLPLVGGARQHDLREDGDLAVVILVALVVGALDHVRPPQHGPQPALLA